MDPPLHDRVHVWHPDAAVHDLDPGVGEDRVEQWRVPDVAVTDEDACPASRVLQVHREGAHGLGYPGGGLLGRSGVHPIAIKFAEPPASSTMRAVH
ncbi:hypothetical protein [Frankia sp. Cj5]|uniref:hypothetical protein n=1 Tax=Frankia sp. Cj5 TaxID=2880978 RepID=UPI001EF54442|nr:hypothetical protein [Frankia sp. Cj5]